MGDDEGRGHDLEPKYPAGGRLLHLRAGEGAQAFALEVGGDAAQHLGKVCAGAAAWVEDVDVPGRQPVGDTQVLLQRHVDPGDHVAHHLGGRVPDAQLLAQLRIEGLQEGLVEVGHRLSCVEAVKEGPAVDAVEGGRGPIQKLDKA